MEKAVDIAAQAAANDAIHFGEKKTKIGDEYHMIDKVRETEFKITYYPAPETCEQWLIDVETIVICHSGRSDNKAGDWFARAGDLNVHSSELAVALLSSLGWIGRLPPPY